MTNAEMLADTVPPTTLPAPPIIKTCGCGRTYDAHEWRGLRLVGFQDDGDGGLIELRDCACGSTIAIEAPATAEDQRRAVRRTVERMRSVGLEP